MNNDFKPTAELKFEFEGANPEALERYRQTIETIIAQGALNLRNGKVILNFDHEGSLQEIGFDYKRWRKKKFDK